MASRKLSNSADRFKDTNKSNQVLGRGGNDFIDARGGNDYIDGGNGDDTQAGGLGRDTFKISSGNDIIQDFKIGTDALKFNKKLRRSPELSLTKTKRGTRLNHEEGTILFKDILKSDLKSFLQSNGLSIQPQNTIIKVPTEIIKEVEKIVEVEKEEPVPDFNILGTGHETIEKPIDAIFGNFFDTTSKEDFELVGGFTELFKLIGDLSLKIESLGWEVTSAKNSTHSPHITLSDFDQFIANSEKASLELAKFQDKLPVEQKEGIEELKKTFKGSSFAFEPKAWGAIEKAIVVNNSDLVVGTGGDDYIIGNGEHLEFKGNPSVSWDIASGPLGPSGRKEGHEYVVVNTRTATIDLSDSKGGTIYAMRDGDYTLIAPQFNKVIYKGDDILLKGSTLTNESSVTIYGGANGGNWKILTQSDYIAPPGFIYGLAGYSLKDDYRWGMNNGRNEVIGIHGPDYEFEYVPGYEVIESI